MCLGAALCVLQVRARAGVFYCDNMLMCMQTFLAGAPRFKADEVEIWLVSPPFVPSAVCRYSSAHAGHMRIRMRARVSICISECGRMRIRMRARVSICISECGRMRIRMRARVSICVSECARAC